jgi:hypothetical protein
MDLELLPDYQLVYSQNLDTPFLLSHIPHQAGIQARSHRHDCDTDSVVGVLHNCKL